jgi:phosphatidylethanolamine/phosphatidyl-N-methylethanolamine N-methyltransferase
MKINTNQWNRIRYTLYTPGYDLVGRIFAASRNKSISQLSVKPNDKILLIGAGTGLDLEFLPTTCEVTATDITPAMIRKIVKKNKQLRLNLNAMVMDGQALTFPANTFDGIILHLILAVIPNPVLCLKEAERVLKPGGKMVVFDKFVPGDQKVSLLRRLFNPITNLMFSDITRNFESMAKHTNLKIASDVPADFGGTFRILLLTKEVNA